VRLRYTLPALADLETILDFIDSPSPQGAARVKSRIEAVIDLLSRHPFIGTPTEDPAIRHRVVTPYSYLVFYEVTKDEIIIHAIRHAARKPSSMPGSGGEDDL
jgi:plasmid stabilization system protein ParE